MHICQNGPLNIILWSNKKFMWYKFLCDLHLTRIIRIKNLTWKFVALRYSRTFLVVMHRKGNVSRYIIAEPISARHHNPIRCWVVIIMITFCFQLKVIMITFCVRLDIVCFFFLDFLTKRYFLGLYVMTKGMNNSPMNHRMFVTAVCVLKVWRSLELLCAL